jgi:hypothetical protein
MFFSSSFQIIDFTLLSLHVVCNGISIGVAFTNDILRLCRILCRWSWPVLAWVQISSLIVTRMTLLGLFDFIFLSEQKNEID